MAGTITENRTIDTCSTQGLAKYVSTNSEHHQNTLTANYSYMERDLAHNVIYSSTHFSNDTPHTLARTKYFINAKSSMNMGHKVERLRHAAAWYQENL